MPIKEVSGNIFDSETQTIVNTVNCMGFMGKGIALEYKYRFPEMYEDYLRHCERKDIQIGTLHYWKQSTKWILNFPTKYNRKFPSKLEYIEKGLETFVAEYKNQGIISISFPRLGVSNGGLNWDDVKKLMYKYLENLDIEILIYNYNSQATDKLFDKLKKLFDQKDLNSLCKISGISRKILEKIILLIRSGEIKNMQGIQNIKGLGEVSIEKIYNLLDKELKIPDNLFG